MPKNKYIKNKSSDADALDRILSGHLIPAGVRSQLHSLIRTQSTVNSALKGQLTALLHAPHSLAKKVDDQRQQLASLHSKIDRLEAENRQLRGDDNNLTLLLNAGAGLFNKKSNQVKELATKPQREKGGHGHELMLRRITPELAGKGTENANGRSRVSKAEDAIESAQKTPKVIVNSDEKDATACLCVGNLCWSVSEARLAHVFEEFGQLQNVRVFTDNHGCSMGYGYVHFTTAEAAARAFVARKGFRLDGYDLDITFDAKAQVPQQRQDFRASTVPGGFGRYSGMQNVWGNY